MVSHLGAPNVFVSNTTVKLMSGFSWNFHDIFAMTQGTIWNILGMISLTHWIQGSFLPLSPPGWRCIVVTVRAGRWAGGCQTCGAHISVTAWWIFSVRSSVELSRPVVVHCHGHLPICPIWACHGPKTCQIWHKLGPDFAERISLKPLDGLTPFKVSWTCLDL